MEDVMRNAVESPDSLEQKMCNELQMKLLQFAKSFRIVDDIKRQLEQMKALQQKHCVHMSEIEKIELNAANEKITRGCITLKENALNTGEALEGLFAQLFKNEKAGILLFGSEEKFLHGFCLWKREQLMDCLTEIIVTCELEDLENVEYLLEKLGEYEVM